MEPARIILYVHQHYRNYWRDKRKLTREAFEEILQPHVLTLTPAQYSRLTSGKVPAKLLPVLQIPAVQQSIERALACPGLFSCADELQVDSMLVPKVDGGQPVSRDTEPSHLLLTGLAGQSVPLLLSNREKRVAEHLARQVLMGSSNILCWTDPPPVGAGFLAFAAADTYLPREGIRSTFLLQPFSHLGQHYLHNDGVVDEPPDFDRGLAEVAEKLGLAARPKPCALLKALKASRSVLFVLQADAIQARARNAPGQMQSLLSEARTSSAPANDEPTPLVLIGRPQGVTLPKDVQLIGDQNQRLAFGTRMGERFEFFEAQWRRFSSLRGNVGPLAVDDSRVKRAQQYYTKDGDASLWPSHLRMLAFFASNNATLSYFDPTAGWDRIAGMCIKQIPIDIRLHLSEAIQLARAIPDTKRGTRLRVARWCSTAVYWLTEDAAMDLGRLRPQTDIAGFRAAVRHLDRVIEVVSRGEGEPPVYKMDIALRAVIQQRWAVRDPFARAKAHYQVADRLYKSRHNKDLLQVEFPVEPHWGRSRMHFLAECLRHLIRASDRSVAASAIAVFAPEHAETFPDPPTSAMRGCDLRQVINFCFGKLYWKELNGNGRLGTVHRRKLALQHGAYQLTAELLQMMSHEQRLGEPHPALNPAYVLRYLREVGYAQLDLGDLASARRTFEKLLELARARDSAPEEILQYLLDLTIVQGAMNDLVSAREGLLAARALAPSHADPDSDRRSRLTFKNVTTRLDAREADLLYLEGDLKGALNACERIERLAPNSISRDVAHVYIATLGALSAHEGQEDYLQRAMCVCVRNLFESTSRFMNHTALGFRVALAHAFRKQGLLNVAEEALDHVYKDVLEYGCSERTYLAMLLEAGRTVLMQGRPARAYAAYFRPCLDRASLRGHARTAAAARKYSRECILKLLADIAAGAPPSPADLHMQLKGKGEYLQAGFPAAIDPKFSYGITDAGHWVSRLSSKETLDAELAKISLPD